MQRKLCSLHAIPYDLQNLYKLYKNGWVGNTLTFGCVQKRQI
jgi:hypothetical protein